MASVLETLFQDVQARLTAIIGNTSYHYGTTLRAVEREVLEANGAEMDVNSLQPPMILIQRGPNNVAPDAATLDEWSRQQEFRILFKLPRSNDEDVGNAIEDMTRALFANGGIPGRLPDWAIEVEDPESRVRLPGPQLIFSTVYSEEIGDPTTGH